jgi:hypothetical protein
MNLRKIVVLVVVAVLWPAGRASAVIQVKMPVSRIYKTSKAVYIGSVTEVTPANRLVDVKVGGALRGDSPGASIRIQIVSPADLIGKVDKGASVVVFVGKARGGAMAVLHLADTWLLAKRAGTGKPETWRVVQRHDAKQTFPGRTTALVRLVKEIASGNAPILDSTEEAFFRNPLRKVAKLNVTNARWILTGDVDRDRSPDLLVGTDKDVRLLLAGKEGYTDATDRWGLKSGAVAWRAVVDVDGDRRVDLLLGDTIWRNTRSKFEAIKLPVPASDAKDPPLAATMFYVRGSSYSRKNMRAVFLSASGRLQVLEKPDSKTKPWVASPARQLWPADSPAVAARFGNFGDTYGLHVLAVRQDGVTRYSLDKSGGAPADFERLTGVNLKKYYERYADGFKNPLVTTLNVNGDRRRDLLIICDTGGMLMVNRGYGSFLCDYDSGGEIAPHAKTAAKMKITAQTAWTSCDIHGDGRDDLLILSADGTLYELSNKPRPAAGEKKR